MTDTSNTPNASMTGLIMIPPPMPHIAPMIEAEKLMIKIKYTYAGVSTFLKFTYV